MSLTEELSVKEILEGFECNIIDDEIVYGKRDLPGYLKYDDVERWID